LFLFRHRLPIGQMRGGWKPWASAIITNSAIVGCVAGLGMLIGYWPFIAVHLPITMLAASFGVWLFYIQHQFEETVWERGDAWTFHVSSLHGSSYYDLPRILHWFTGNIGLHNVHHLVSRIPFYRLPEVMKVRPGLDEVGRVTMLQSLRCVHLALWDEERRRLVSFRDAKRSHPEAVCCR
jgi:omega-6 fatty acid desaturase (delta-12 desaturase)